MLECQFKKSKRMKRLAALAAGIVTFLSMGYQACAIENYQLNGITVWADKGTETLVEPLGNLADEHVNIPLLGTKDSLDTPFTAMTISREAADYFSSPDKGMVDMLTLHPAVRDDSRSTFNNFIDVRGLMMNGASMYLNGIPNMMSRTDQMFNTDNYINKVTVIAGPNIGIGGTPLAQYPGGGAIYYESKKAMARPNTDLKLSWRGNKSFEEALDIGRRFGDGQRYGVRFNISNISGETNIKPESIRSRDVYVNIDQRTSHNWTNLLIGHSYGHTEGAAKHFSFDKKLTSIPQAPKGNRSYTPKWAYAKAENFVIALNHEQKFNDHVTGFFNFGRNVNHPYESVYTWGGRNLDSNGNFTSDFNNRLAKTENIYGSFGIKGQFDLGSTHHEYVINADRNWQKSYGVKNSWKSGKFKDNIYHYLGNWDVPDYYMGSLYHSSSMYTNAYHFLDSISINDRLTLLLGYHHHSTKVTNATNGTKKYSAGSPTYGINYKINPHLSVYASHSEDFAYGKVVGAGYENAGEALDPYKTKQNEIGVKFKNGDLLHTLAYYTIKQGNYIEWEQPGTDKLYLRKGDDKKNKGFEYTIAGKLSDKWDIIGGVSYVDAKNTRTGDPISQVAKWSGTLGLVYSPNEDLAFTARLQYLGHSPVMLNKEVTMPSHTLLHLGAAYKTNMGKTPVTINAQLYNVFNKRYWTPTEGRIQANVGEPRTFVLSTTFHF